MTKLKVIKGIGKVMPQLTPKEKLALSESEYDNWITSHPSGLLCVYPNGEIARDGESEGELVWQLYDHDYKRWEDYTIVEA